MHTSGGVAWSADFSPDGRRFATISDDYFPRNGAEVKQSTVTLWDTATEQPMHRDPIRFSAGLDGLAFSPDGRLLAASTISNDGKGEVRVWELDQSQLVAQPQVPNVRSLAFSPDGAILALASATINGSVTFLDTSNWQQFAPTIVGLANSIAFSPDGTEFAIASAGQVSLWDVASGTRLGSTYAGPPSNPYGLARFLPDGRILLMTQDQPIFVFRTDAAAWKTQACAIVGDITPEEWQAMAPAEPYHSICNESG